MPLASGSTRSALVPRTVSVVTLAVCLIATTAVAIGAAAPPAQVAQAVVAAADPASTSRASAVGTLQAVSAQAESGDGPGSFVSLPPARLYDSRPGRTTTDNQHAGHGRLTAGQRIEVQITGRGNVPTNTPDHTTTAAILNVTAVDATHPGHITVFPCTPDTPTASSLNYWPGTPALPNELITKLTPTGTTCLTTHAPIDLIIDVVGYITEPSSYHPLNPARLYDSRPGRTTTDNQHAGHGRLTAGQRIEVQITGRGN
ncbi:MAG TPA: hypothetical protein VNQ73_00980, partial [Ilumatobacter sp.]|nr:hypothetical protein [Ilumatobacter sp.]